MGINERCIIQEIKTIANLEHRYNPYNSSWGLYWNTANSYWKEKNNEQPGIH